LPNSYDEVTEMHAIQAERQAQDGAINQRRLKKQEQHISLLQLSEVQAAEAFAGAGCQG